MYKNSQEGFSLIEILVVVAIIGLLAVLVVVGLKPQEIFANGRNSRRVDDVEAINTAIAQWMSREGTENSNFYSILGLTDSGVNAMDSSNGIDASDGISVTNLTPIVSSGYLTSIPSDPVSGNLGYRVGVDNLTNPTSVVVCSGEIEITSSYTSANYPNGVYCLSN